MKSCRLLPLFCAFFLSCRGEPITGTDLNGVWRCDDLPVGLAKKLGVDSSVHKSEVVLRKDGSYEVKGFPLRGPYRLVDSHGAWSLMAADITPSGKESIYLEGCYLVPSRKFGSLRLSYLVSGKDSYRLIFQRVEHPFKEVDSR